MSPDEVTLRRATADDRSAVLGLWTALVEEDAPPAVDTWSVHAEAWSTRSVTDATAVGSSAIGVPIPWCPGGRTVRLEHLYTRPSHRGRGLGTMLVLDIVAWARQHDADRVDLSTTPLGRSVDERAGFTTTAAPRMKLIL